mmetsp:Transcript_19024/g.26541  ORF Transcript_19024/g.26541 Transcript_19024/m.26541 type:complete len:252 (+) Transcript_19024:55-810(+)|eukprot:CAMPEP_0184481018 /NCGR_PEP_ID=MMETSP0113_2-20130426/2568_1 /TAXON_ID=91329 /ORGANISM="Norrisiella sphaerica, Strain BC52" /LENGTH=251 /DNA_ID=CAMNT_0026859895 /DNA_START=46 /DNA_END=801 /DNA_ORIENTATION=+
MLHHTALSAPPSLRRRRRFGALVLLAGLVSAGSIVSTGTFAHPRYSKLEGEELGTPLDFMDGGIQDNVTPVAIISGASFLAGILTSLLFRGSSSSNRLPEPPQKVAEKVAEKVKSKVKPSPLPIPKPNKPKISLTRAREPTQTTKRNGRSATRNQETFRDTSREKSLKETFDSVPVNVWILLGFLSASVFALTGISMCYCILYYDERQEREIKEHQLQLERLKRRQFVEQMDVARRISSSSKATSRAGTYL